MESKLVRKKRTVQRPEPSGRFFIGWASAGGGIDRGVISDIFMCTGEMFRLVG